MKRYSNNSYQGKHLRRVVEMTDQARELPIRETQIPTVMQRVDRRLSAESIAELVQAYRDGVSTPELGRRYELGHGSVIKILHSHGVVMRNQGLAGDDVATAAALYRDGTTLAQLGEQFGVSPNAVRRVLVANGMTMRVRGGSKPRG
jgi:hypothetical protein